MTVIIDVSILIMFNVLGIGFILSVIIIVLYGVIFVVIVWLLFNAFLVIVIIVVGDILMMFN